MKNRIVKMALLASALMFASCSGVAFLNTITPSSSYSLAKNIEYGKLGRQKLDIYQPDEPRADAPIIVFVYGGSWSSGKKGMYKFVGEAFASEGLTTVIPDYRLHPEVIYPQFVNDTAAAIAFVAKRYPERSLVLMGHSAGAYNVMMVTVDPKYLKTQGVDMCQRIAGTVGLAGPYGAFPMKKEPYITIFPGRQEGDDAPVQRTLGPAPPIFVPIGDKDTTVSDQHSRELADKVNARGGAAKFKLYPGLSHTDIAKVLSRYFDEDSELMGDVLNFIETNSAQQDNYCH